MAKELVRDELWEAIEPLQPPEPSKHKSCRPRVPARAVLTGIVFVLKSGIPWEMLPQGWGAAPVARAGDGCASGTRRACGGSCTECSSTGWVRPTRSTGRERPWTRRAWRRKRGESVGKNPTDRGKLGSKRHLVTDGKGVPLPVALTAANVHDSKVLEELLESIEPIKRPRGRPKKRPEKLHADKGYDLPRCREALRMRDIKLRIARRGKDTSERLGRHRWVVERTLAWLGKYRRLAVRYERRDNIHEGFLHLGCSLICLNYLL